MAQGLGRDGHQTNGKTSRVWDCQVFLLDNQFFFLYTLDLTLRWAVLSSESPDGTGGLGLIDRQAHGEFFYAAGAVSILGLMS